MSNIKIQNVDQRVQYIATSLQTAFAVPFPFLANSDLVVYQNSSLLVLGSGAGQYGLSGAGNPSGGTLTLVTGATTNDIITILGNQPIDRTSIYSATISNLTGSDLNNDFNREIIMLKQLWTSQNLLQLQYQPYALVSQDEAVTLDRWLPVLAANQGWAKNAGNTAIVAYDLPAGGAAPKLGKYLIQTANADLPNAQSMGALASGLVVNTTTTGVQLTRTLTGTANQIDVTNGTGISGAPTFSITSNPVIPGTAGMGIPQGTTAQRVTPSSGIGLRYNTTIPAMEFYEAGNWVQLDDSDLSLYLLRSGGTMTGVLNMNGNAITMGTAKITGLGDPTLDQDAATKAYVDGSGGGGPPFLELAGGTMAGVIDMDGNAITMGTAKITGLGDPTANQDAATKFYVDQTALTGTSVYAASIATLGTVTQSGAGAGATLTNAGAQAALVLDSVSPPVGSNVLIKDTATGMTDANEGIYTVTDAGSGASNWVLTRSTSYDTVTEINNTGLITVRHGTTLEGTQWYNSATIAVVDTTSFSYSQFGSTFLSSTLADGKIFRGNDSNLAVATTASYPNVATATGAMMYADGANFVASTSLWPNTVGAAGTLVRSDGTTNAYTTTTYPNTNAENSLLYASGANVMAALATANSSFLVTGAGGIPAWSALPVAIAQGGTGSVTVDTARAALGAAPNPNIIIGGNFSTNPWQRGVSFTAPTSQLFTADRWKSTFINDGVCDMLKTLDAPTLAQAGVYTDYCLNRDVTTLDAALTETQYDVVGYFVEGYDIALAGFGQSNGRPITLSFWHKHTTTGVYCVAFTNSASNRSYVAEYTQAVTDTWEKATITVTPDTTGTWLYTSGTGLKLWFTNALGETSDFHTTANTWAAGAFFGTTSQVNNLSSASNFFKLALVKLELGSVATPFPVENAQETLDKCLRYYKRYYATGNIFNGLMGQAYSTTAAFIVLNYAVPMRSTVTLGYSLVGDITLTRAAASQVDCTVLTLVSGASTQRGEQLGGYLSAQIGSAVLAAGNATMMLIKADGDYLEFISEL